MDFWAEVFKEDEAKYDNKYVESRISTKTSLSTIVKEELSPYLLGVLPGHGGGAGVGPAAVAAAPVTVGAVPLEVQLLGHRVHVLQRLRLLLFGQLLHGQESEIKCKESQHVLDSGFLSYLSGVKN